MPKKKAEEIKRVHVTLGKEPNRVFKAPQSHHPGARFAPHAPDR